MSPALSFATFIPSQKKQAGGVPRKNQPGLRAVQKISLSWLFSFTESPGGTSASGLWGGSAQKGVWGVKEQGGPGRREPRGFAMGWQEWRARHGAWSAPDGGHPTCHQQDLFQCNL